MRIRTALLPAIGVTAMLLSGTALAQKAAPGGRSVSEQPTKQQAKIGEKAPNFSLPDADGKMHELSDFSGKIVILQWINPDCPVCRRVSDKGIVNAMAKELKQLDENVVHLTINSTHYMEAEKSAKYLEKHEIKAPALIDKAGTVGRMYGARTTPHVFVIDAKGVLRYQGAIDDDPRGSKGDERMNFAVNAVRQIKMNETVAPDSTTPYGCSVKYARGS